jgi:hypothetical protein
MKGEKKWRGEIKKENKLKNYLKLKEDAIENKIKFEKWIKKK